MLSDYFGWKLFVFLQSAWISAFGLELKNKRKIAHIFICWCSQSFLEKRKKKTLYVNRVSAIHYLNLPHLFMKCLRGTRQMLRVFQLCEIRTVKSRFKSCMFCFFFFFFWQKYTLFYCYYFVFSTTNCKPASKRHFRGKKSSHGLK